MARLQWQIQVATLLIRQLINFHSDFFLEYLKPPQIRQVLKSIFILKNNILVRCELDIIILKYFWF